MDRFVENHFDSSHNTFESVRRIADIYEWGNNVLWPGFFADMGPCSEDVGLPSALGAKGCNDDAWPDGEGSFQVNGATPLGLDELVKRMDQFDFTEGIYVKQVARAKRELQLREKRVCGRRQAGRRAAQSLLLAPAMRDHVRD